MRLIYKMELFLMRYVKYMDNMDRDGGKHLNVDQPSMYVWMAEGSSACRTFSFLL